MTGYKTECSHCKNTNVTAHYAHGTDHQWSMTPSYGPTPTGAPHPKPCPVDDLAGNSVPRYPATHTICNVCQYKQTSWPVGVS